MTGQIKEGVIHADGNQPSLSPMVFNGRPGAKPEVIEVAPGPKKDTGNFFTNLIHKIENSKPIQFIEDKVHDTEDFIKDVPHKVEQGIHIVADDAKKGLDYVGNTFKSGIKDVTDEAEKVALDGALLVGGVILGAIVIMKLL